MPTKNKPKKGSDSNANKYSPTTWGKEFLHDLETPSGQICQARRIGPSELIRRGFLDKIDVLGAVVQADHIDRVNGRSAATEAERDVELNKKLGELLNDPSQLLTAFEMIDAVVCEAVVQPKVHPLPVPDPETGEIPVRIDGAVYVDSVDETDKMFIFTWCMGGTRDLVQFRQGLHERMEDLAAIQDVPDTTERPSED